MPPSIRLVCFAAALILCSGFAYAGPADAGFGEPRLLVAAPEDERIAHLSWPKVVMTDNGGLILAYSAGIGHNIGGSGPAVSVSKDGGETFSEPRLLAYFPDDDDRYEDCGNMALGLAGDGAVVLLAMAYRGNEANTILGWRSINDGLTWRPVDTSNLAENQTGSVYGHVFSTPGAGLAVAGHYREPSEPYSEGIWLSFSGDDGRSWSAAERVADQRLFEPAVIYAGGRFIGLVRDGDTEPPYWQITGNGDAWRLERSGVRPLEDLNLRAPSPFLTVDPDDPTRLWALESQRFGEGGGAIWLWTANTDTLEWRRVGQVVDFPGDDPDHADITYPWMTPLGDGEWFLVFYSGQRRGPSSIYGMKISLNETIPE